MSRSSRSDGSGVCSSLSNRARSVPLNNETNAYSGVRPGGPPLGQTGYRVTAVEVGMFSGFGEHAVEFFDGIAEDNSKAYWTDHQHIYQSDVREPMEALLAELAGEFAEFGKVKVFRPYRDVRFSKDKTPYKTHCGGVIERARGAGACYVQIGSEGLRIGGGSFHMAPAQLERSHGGRRRPAWARAAIPAGPTHRRRLAVAWRTAQNRASWLPRGPS